MLERLIFFLCAMSLFLHAHPHVFIDTKVEVKADSIRITWIFDEMSSSIIVSDYDKNKDKKLDAEEIAVMEKEHFKTLANYSYFLHLFDGNKEYSLKKTSDFSASYNGKQLTYTYSIPKPPMKKYAMHFYDPEMYVALIIKKEFLSCQAPIQCRVEGYDADYYYAYKVVVDEEGAK